MGVFIRLIFPILAIYAMSAQVIAAENDLPNWREETLSGDWGGERANLYKKGIDFGLTHKSDVLINTSGGVKQGIAWLGHSEVRLTLDLEKLWGWSGATAYSVFESDLGSKFNAHYVGAFKGVDNIEVGTNTALFYQAWLQKNILDDHASFLAGLYAVDSEFYVTETSGLFLQPPYGMANEVAQAGANGPPIFPLGALAVRMKLTSPGGNFYVQTAITDGVPGDPNNPHGTHIKLGHGDGTFSIAEFGYTPKEVSVNIDQSKAQEQPENFNKTAIGFWHFSSRFNTIDHSSPRQHNQGVYVLAERSLIQDRKHTSQGLAGFLRFGLASNDVNQADWSGSVGLRYHGLIAGRDNDIVGFGITVSHAGNMFRQANALERQETDFEATYRAQITPYFVVQPTLQAIINPSMDPAIRNAWVVGSRFEVEF